MKIHKNGKKKECREKTKKMKTKDVVGRKKRIRGEAGRKTVKEGFWRGIRKQRGRDERREGGGGGKGRTNRTEEKGKGEDRRSDSGGKDGRLREKGKKAQDEATKEREGEKGKRNEEPEKGMEGGGRKWKG